MRKRTSTFIFLSLILGAVVGGLAGQLLGIILPDGVVKNFFLASIKPGFDFGPVDLIVIQFHLSLYIVLNFVSLVGMGFVYYLLRFLR